MKKTIYFLFISVLAISTSMAQSPRCLSYQAIIRSANGSVISNTQVGLRISILSGTASGAAVCVEEFSPTTNEYGLISLEIGSENPAGFDTIKWGADKYFIKVEVDPAGGTAYTEMGTSQLLSVPYALHAGVADSVLLTGNEPIFDGWDKDENDAWEKTGNNPYILEGKVGIGTNFVDEAITMNTGANRAYTAYRNNATGVRMGDGFRTGINSDASVYIWNAENTDMRFGTNNLTRMVIENDGDVGIGISEPTADLHVNGRSKFGLNGTAFIAIQEHTGTTHASNAYTVSTLPSGFNETNTRILSLEINYNSDRWVGLGYNNTGSYDLSYLINGTTLYVYYPDVTQLKGRSFRALLMRIE